MRDLKQITSNSKPLRTRLFHWRIKPSRNIYRHLLEGKKAKRRLRFILPIVAILLAAYPVASLLFSAKNAISSVKKAPPQPVKTFSPLDPFQSFQLASESLSTVQLSGGHFVATLPDGGTILYALDQDLQERVKKVMATNHVPYGAFVAIEPK